MCRPFLEWGPDGGAAPDTSGAAARPRTGYSVRPHTAADRRCDVAARRRWSGDVVYDLGSGDGRIVIIAAQKYGARGVGIELVPRLVEMSRELAREGEVEDRVTFVEGDLFTADISEATVVTLYLSPGINRRLLPKLKTELRPGARIVSRQFRFGSWLPDAAIRAEDGTDLFLWTVPSR